MSEKEKMWGRCRGCGRWVEGLTHEWCGVCGAEVAKYRRAGNGRKQQCFEVLSGGGPFRGLLPVTGFFETVRAGCFPDGMLVRDVRKGQKFVVRGKVLEHV